MNDKKLLAITVTLILTVAFALLMYGTVRAYQFTKKLSDSVALENYVKEGKCNMDYYKLHGECYYWYKKTELEYRLIGYSLIYIALLILTWMRSKQ